MVSINPKAERERAAEPRAMAASGAARVPPFTRQSKNDTPNQSLNRIKNRSEHGRTKGWESASVPVRRERRQGTQSTGTAIHPQPERQRAAHNTRRAGYFYAERSRSVLSRARDSKKVRRMTDHKKDTKADSSLRQCSVYFFRVF